MAKQKHAGIIDLGTNTFHYLIVRYNNSTHYEILKRGQQPVKIGQGGIQNREITPEAFNRGINTLCEFKQELEKYCLDELRIIGTSALRNATNSKTFLDQVENLFKHGTQLIDGDQEARLIYYGVKMAGGIGTQPSVILDIGGGSVELIIADHEEIKWKESFEIGAARLIEQFPHDFPISYDQARAIKDYLDQKLEPFKEAISRYPAKSLVGASGSFETFTQLELSNSKGQINGTLPVFHAIDPNYFDSMKHKIINATKKEISQMPGMVQFRVEMMVVASLIVDYIINQAGIEQIYFSDYAMKEGAFLAFLKDEL